MYRCKILRAPEADTCPTRANRGQLARRRGAVEYKAELDAPFPRLRRDLKRTPNGSTAIDLINLTAVLPQTAMNEPRRVYADRTVSRDARRETCFRTPASRILGHSTQPSRASTFHRPLNRRHLILRVLARTS